MQEDRLYIYQKEGYTRPSTPGVPALDRLLGRQGKEFHSAEIFFLLYMYVSSVLTCQHEQHLHFSLLKTRSHESER